MSPDLADAAITTAMNTTTIAQLRLIEARLVVERSSASVPGNALLDRRLAALRSLLADGTAPLAPPDDAAATREARMDAARVARSRDDEYGALMEHARFLTQAETPIPTPRPVRTSKRVVLVHRNAWFRGRVRAALEQAGVDVVADLDDGAQAVGTILAEQPDLVLVEDLLPSYPGLEVVARLRRHCPDVLFAVQLDGSSQAPAFLAEGVQVVTTRRIPPVEVAGELLRLLEAACPADDARPAVLV